MGAEVPLAIVDDGDTLWDATRRMGEWSIKMAARGHKDLIFQVVQEDYVEPYRDAALEAWFAAGGTKD
jgi:hypothetical protein